MIETLKIINLPSNKNVPLNIQENSFILQTCQRTVVVGLNYAIISWGQKLEEPKHLYVGEPAYTFLLEIICGLQSKVVAENEIVNQFKTAYDEFKRRPTQQKNALLMQCLEKLFKDAKDIRTNHLLGINQKTYGALARKKLLEKQVSLERVLVLGSGNLAVCMINQLKKHAEVYVSARNEIKVAELVDQHGVTPIAWRDLDLYKNFKYIVNTIGANEIILNHSFFTSWDLLHAGGGQLIDLGSPSVLETSYGIEKGVVRLENIFEEGRMSDQQKLTKVETARKAIKEVAHKRSISFTMNLPFCWEELQFD